MKRQISNIERNLRALGRPVVVLSDMANALGVQYQTLAVRLRDPNSGLTQPDTFNAGGSRTMILDAAIDWCELHQKEHDAILQKSNNRWLIDRRNREAGSK